MAIKKVQKSPSKYLVGAGIAAAAAAGVIGFLTQTKKGKALASKGKEHAAELAKSVAMKAEKMKNLTQEKYEEIVDDIVADYQRRRKITKDAAKELAVELKKEWTRVRKELKK